MKPFQIILLAVFGVLALLGLFFFATYKGIFGGGNSPGTVVIWGTLPSQSVGSVLSDIKNANQTYGGVSYVERPRASFNRDVAEAIAAGQGPDIIIISQEDLLVEKSRLSLIPFKTIPERTFKDSYVAMSSLFLDTGGTYGIPVLIDPLVLYYNRAVISRAGYASAPATWEEVLGATPTLTQKDGTALMKSAIALGTYGNIENARAILSLLFLQSGNPITSTRGTSGLESVLGKSELAGTALTPAQSALSFYTQFADPAKLVYTWNRSLGSARQSFIAGDSALYLGYASEYTFIKSANPNLDFDMRAVPSPETSGSRSDYALLYALAIPKAGKNVTGAYTVASALAAGEYTGKLASYLGMAPALRSLLGTRGVDANADVYYPLALISNGWLSPAPEVTDRIFAGMITSVISGSQTVQQALHDADQALSSSL